MSSLQIHSALDVGYNMILPLFNYLSVCLFTIYDMTYPIPHSPAPKYGHSGGFPCAQKKTNSEPRLIKRIKGKGGKDTTERERLDNISRQYRSQA